MNTGEARTMAKTLMAEHGLVFWIFRLDSVRRRFGHVSYESRCISMSKELVELNSTEQVRSVLLATIAEAAKNTSVVCP